jgi:hypothetical protein
MARLNNRRAPGDGEFPIVEILDVLREREAQGPPPTRDASAARTVASASNGRM